MKKDVINNEPQDEGLSAYIAKVFYYMFIGLLITGVTGYLVSSSNTALEFIYGNSYMFYVVIIAELALVFSLSGLIAKISPAVAKVLFLVYAFVSGLTFSVFFLAFEISSILYLFGLTSILFGGLSLVGYVTKKDLTKIGNFLLFGLLISIIISIFNIFIFKSSGLDLILTIISLVIFLGLTIYDMQKIKRHYVAYRENEEMLNKAAIYGALELYLDFINILIKLLRLFGKRRN